MAFGEILKQARLDRGWTKVYVSERTHMMMKTIDALEMEDLKKIPAPIYGRGFIRQYATLLKLDVEPLIEDYMRCVSDETYKPRTHSHTTTKTIEENSTQTMHFTQANKPHEAQPTNDLFERPVTSDIDEGNRKRTIVKPKDRSDELTLQNDTSNIFAPYRPVPSPVNPQLRSLLTIIKSIRNSVTKSTTRSETTPQSHGKSERVCTPRIFYQALIFFILLVALTGLIVLFRYLFQLSEKASTEYGIAPQSERASIAVRPVATPPEPYFE